MLSHVRNSEIMILIVTHENMQNMFPIGSKILFNGYLINSHILQYKLLNISAILFDGYLIEIS
jgi:hypothetical protein